MVILLKTKWKLITMLSVLAILLAGKITYAAENFFWSDAVPVPSCYESKDGTKKELGMVIDGKKVVQDIPTCEEAKKKRVLVLVNGKYLHTLDGSGADPFIENGRTMIPLRAVADAFGFEVDWEQNEKKITLTKESKQIIMHIGKSEMSVDGEKVDLGETAPMIQNDVTFLPVRPLAEILGIDVDWEAKTRTATFTE